MEKIDEDMLIRFMHEQKEEVKDNGFSHRVMRHLPKKHQWINWLFNAVCVTVCLCLFYILNGMEILFNTLKELSLSCSPQVLIGNANLTTLGIALGALVIIGISRACSLED